MPGLTRVTSREKVTSARCAPSATALHIETDAPELAWGAAPGTPSPGGSGPRLVLPPQYSKRLVYCSLGATSSIVVSLHCGLWDCAIASVLVVSTSLNYWRNPLKPSLRRTTDMLVVLLVGIYNMWRAQDCANIRAFWMVMNVACPFWYQCARMATDLDKSSRCHCMLHVCANLANFILYLGLPRGTYSPPLDDLTTLKAGFATTLLLYVVIFKICPDKKVDPLLIAR